MKADTNNEPVFLFVESNTQRIARSLCLAVILAIIFGCGIFCNAELSADARQAMADGLTTFNNGQFRQSLGHWQEAMALYDEAGDDAEGSVRARINLAAAYQSLGENKMASRVLLEALDLAEREGKSRDVVAARSALGNASIFSRQAPLAEAMLIESLALAREENDKVAVSSILNNLGNLYVGRKDFSRAMDCFNECMELAEKDGVNLLALRAAINAASCLLRSGDYAGSGHAIEQAWNALSRVKDSYQRAYLLLSAGQIYYQLAVQEDPVALGLLLKAHEAYRQARAIAARHEDDLLLSYADGYTGRLYELTGRYEEALVATRSAVFYAQRIQAPDALYRWQWQIGRIFVAQGDRVPAIASYRQALATLQMIRHDLAIGYGNRNRGSSFRRELGPLFFELADLLLQRSEYAQNEAGAQAYLIEARSVIEQLKSAELEDYFQDDCVNIIRARTAGVEAILDKAAVVYFIPLEDRTELLLTLPSGLKRFHVPVGTEALFKEVSELRKYLAMRTMHKYKRPGKKLYDWLIQPIESDLQAEAIDTLVFVPDGALRTVPMAALHDGDQFLIEKYAVAITPGLTLMDPRPIRRENVQILVNGLSESVQGFPSLPSVPDEIKHIESNYQTKSFVDKDFLMESVSEALANAPFGIVHIASHGQFKGEARDSFLLTYDQKLTLDGLEQLIRPSQYRGSPVELLTLSACQTAAGDDRAALGLAGVAIKAGARSAMATLWFVSDEASSKMLEVFYSQLKQPNNSKAKALQHAQLEMLNDQRFRHPRYWSPYLIIGNWL